MALMPYDLWREFVPLLRKSGSGRLSLLPNVWIRACSLNI